MLKEILERIPEVIMSYWNSKISFDTFMELLGGSLDSGIKMREEMLASDMEDIAEVFAVMLSKGKSVEVGEISWRADFTLEENLLGKTQEIASEVISITERMNILPSLESSFFEALEGEKINKFYNSNLLVEHRSILETSISGISEVKQLKNRAVFESVLVKNLDGTYVKYIIDYLDYFKNEFVITSLNIELLRKKLTRIHVAEKIELNSILLQSIVRLLDDDVIDFSKVQVIVHRTKKDFRKGEQYVSFNLFGISQEIRISHKSYTYLFDTFSLLKYTGIKDGFLREEITVWVVLRK